MGISGEVVRMMRGERGGIVSWGGLDVLSCCGGRLEWRVGSWYCIV